MRANTRPNRNLCLIESYVYLRPIDLLNYEKKKKKKKKKQQKQKKPEKTTECIKFRRTAAQRRKTFCRPFSLAHSRALSLSLCICFSVQSIARRLSHTVFFSPVTLAIRTQLLLWLLLTWCRMTVVVPHLNNNNINTLFSFGVKKKKKIINGFDYRIYTAC